MRKTKRKSSKTSKLNKIFLSCTSILIMAAGASAYFIYDALQEDELSELYISLNKDNSNVNLVKSIKNNIEDSSLSSDTNRIEPSKRNIDVNCIWIEDQGNKNVTFYDGTQKDVYKFAIDQDVECEVKFKAREGEKGGYLDNQVPKFIFDDFVQNFFSDSKFQEANIEITKTSNEKFCPFLDFCFNDVGTTKNNFQEMKDYILGQKEYIINSAEMLVSTMLDRLPFGPELSLINNITFQNRTTSSSFEQDANGLYQHVPIQNDVNNFRTIKLIVDTYTENTKPLKSDVSNDSEVNFRFDVENVIHTLVHEYSHHITLYSEQLTKDVFLDKMKNLFSDSKLLENSISCSSSDEVLKEAKVGCGTWDDFEEMYKYANDYSSALGDEEIVRIFRHLFGMTKINKDDENDLKVDYPKGFEHKLKLKKSDEEDFGEEYVDLSKFNNTVVVNTNFKKELNSFDVHGAQKLSKLIPKADSSYTVYEQEINATKYDARLDCQNEHFYFYGKSIDFEAFVSKNNAGRATANQLDASLLRTIKYFFSMEEQLARIFSILSFQYNKDSKRNFSRANSGCGFSLVTDGFRPTINFNSEVRLENKQFIDYLALKRFGIDVYKEPTKLLELFIPTKKANENEFKLARYNQVNDGDQRDLYYFPKSVSESRKIVTTKDGNYETYPTNDYRLLGLLNLEDSHRNEALSLYFQLDEDIIFRATPFNYNNYFYYDYKEGDIYSVDNFERREFKTNDIGVSFNVGGRSLTINQMASIYSKDKILDSVLFIDRNKNQKFDDGDKRVKLTLN